MFKKLEISNWRQFDTVDIKFDKRLTILTGANGSGKTTVLNILGRHFGWIADIASTPKFSEEGDLQYDTDYHENNEEDKEIEKKLVQQRKDSHTIGTLEYFGNDKICDIRVPIKAGTTYQLLLANQQTQKGLFLSSHRNVFHYQAVSSIPTKPIQKKAAHDQYKTFLLKKYKEEYTGGTGATLQIKQTLISWAVYGYGNPVVKPDQKAREMFESFQRILSDVLPSSLGYKKLEIDNPEVVLVTTTGNFAIDAVSGGIAALIEICWQIFMCGKEEEEYTVIIDEPENHLHPELQRSVLPSLLKAFPKVQFIVATHNPFIISSAENSRVYVLDYNENRKVISHCLDDINKAGTANEILREVLGIPVTLAMWVENRLDNIIKKYLTADITKDTIEAMKNELREIGLESMIPDSIISILERSKRHD